ncbi:uncharacterized protein LOC113281128 isoform X2 [Papaver somniferum]|uniref:uncharacterized protein LOC113281128 isoform X2 n=1 Tax=Papaver somniferum TaxID=3469 RepID=UPI000E6F6E4F|nr:uncharacterized protein LOC113281128 isoform X2 [Papaver somniferum]
MWAEVIQWRKEFEADSLMEVKTRFFLSRCSTIYISLRLRCCSVLEYCTDEQQSRIIVEEILEFAFPSLSNCTHFRSAVYCVADEDTFNSSIGVPKRLTEHKIHSRGSSGAMKKRSRRINFKS